MNYRDRNGNTILNTSAQEKLLHKLYSSKTGYIALKIMVIPLVTELLGNIMYNNISKIFINPIIKYFKIDMDDFIADNFKCYNDFFTRRIKEEKRPINMEKNILISPCDGKLSAYKITQGLTFSVKNSSYTVSSILRDIKLAKEFKDGYCLIFRLSADDCHRYCYVDNLKKTKNRRIKGFLTPVNPVIHDYTHYKVYNENTREYTVLHTENFGKIVQIEVGSMFVGRIKNYHQSGSFKKGIEKGFFEYGGSIIILLIQKDKVSLDNDYLLNTNEHFETIVKLGEQIGISK